MKEQLKAPNKVSDDFKSFIPLDGEIHIYQTKNGERTKLETHNIVVNYAREVVRDLVFGDTRTITKLVMGDLNLTPVEQTPPNVINEADLNETTLVNQRLELPLTSKTKLDYEGRKAILYKFNLATDQGNGPDGYVYYCELGLAMADDMLFTKKNRKSIIKDSEIGLEFHYYLLF